jgi:hypothetical protein
LYKIEHTETIDKIIYENQKEKIKEIDTKLAELNPDKLKVIKSMFKSKNNYTMNSELELVDFEQELVGKYVCMPNLLSKKFNIVEEDGDMQDSVDIDKTGFMVICCGLYVQTMQAIYDLSMEYTQKDFSENASYWRNLINST